MMAQTMKGGPDTIEKVNDAVDVHQGMMHNNQSDGSKVSGTAITAGLMATHLCEKGMVKYVEMMDMEFASGRSKAAAQLHELRPSKVAGELPS